MTAAITVTDRACARIRQLIESRDKPALGIKIGVRTKGCSGLSYVLEFAEEIGEYDEVVEIKDKDGRILKILIDPKAIMFLIGTEMDFVEEKLTSGFVFNNPNEKGRCGCGESFHV